MLTKLYIDTEYTGPELVAHANELIPFIQPTLTSPIPRVVVASARAFLSMLFDIREVRIRIFLFHKNKYKNSFDSYFFASLIVILSPY